MIHLKLVLHLFHQKIEDTGEEYEVIGTQLDVKPIGYYPQSVSLLTYDPSVIPKPKIDKVTHDKLFIKHELFPPIEEQEKMKEEGTYVYKRYFK